MNNRLFGFHIKNYREGKGMPWKYKVFTISLLWLKILISIYFFISLLWVEILLIIITIAVSTHIILTRPKKISKEIDKGLAPPSLKLYQQKILKEKICSNKY